MNAHSIFSPRRLAVASPSPRQQPEATRRRGGGGSPRRHAIALGRRTENGEASAGQKWAVFDGLASPMAQGKVWARVAPLAVEKQSKESTLAAAGKVPKKCLGAVSAWRSRDTEKYGPIRRQAARAPAANAVKETPKNHLCSPPEIKHALSKVVRFSGPRKHLRPRINKPEIFRRCSEPHGRLSIVRDGVHGAVTNRKGGVHGG
jgi:hypothetical protein